MVELSLMLPLLLLILVGTIDLGRAFFDYVRRTNAVREGALTGIRIPDPTVVQYRVTQEANPSMSLQSITVTCHRQPTTGTWTGSEFTSTVACNTARPGDMIQVRASYIFRPFSYEIIRLLGTGITITKTVRMVLV